MKVASSKDFKEIYLVSTLAKQTRTNCSEVLEVCMIFCMPSKEWSKLLPRAQNCTLRVNS